MLSRLLTTSFAFAAIGLASGLFFREWTKALDFTGPTQLGLAHTHFLVLGFMVLFLAFLAEKAFRFAAAAPRIAAWFYWTWVVGVGLTGGMMVLKGALAASGADVSSAAFSGIAGLGHVLLTAGFVLFFLALRRAVLTSAAVTSGGAHDAVNAPAAATSPASSAS